jgi:hypothetical protein
LCRESAERVLVPSIASAAGFRDAAELFRHWPDDRRVVRRGQDPIILND